MPRVCLFALHPSAPSLGIFPCCFAMPLIPSIASPASLSCPGPAAWCVIVLPQCLQYPPASFGGCPHLGQHTCSPCSSQSQAFVELAKPPAQPACKTSAFKCHLGSGSAGAEHDFYINFPSVSPFSRAQPGLWEKVRAGPAILCVSVPSWDTSGPKLPGKTAP